MLNYLAYDSDGVPPTIQLSSNLTNDEAEEGKSIRVTAEVQDDVQVRNVEFYVDGVKAATDGNYPFQFRTLAPLQSEQSSLAIRARASDTGGNATFSDDLEIAVALDATPPQVVSHNPSDGAFLDPLPGLAVFLSEPIDPASIGASTIQLIEAGPDGVFGNNDDVEVTGGTFNYHENRNAVSYTLPEVLPPGSYEARPTMDLRDPAGNQLLEDFTWRFYSPVISGQWDFDDGDLRATVGIDMEFADGVGGATDIATRFGGTDTLGVSNIDGSVAEVMEFPKATPGMGTLLHTGLDPNGGGNLVNQYTLIMDVMFPAASSGKVRGLFSTDNQGDFDFFASAANGIGANGTFHGVLAPGTWHRVAVAVDLGANTMSKFIDGDLVGEQALDGIDGRWALQPAGQAEDHLILFSDDNGESELGYVNSIQLHNARLPDAVIEAYGGPTAAPIPTDLPPRIVRVSPEPEGTIESLDTVLVYFSEPLNEASLSVDTVQVFAAGADRELGTGDDERIPAAFSHYDPLLLSIEVQLERTLSAGGYEGRVQPGVEDLNGNAAANEFEWRFTVGIAIVQDAVIDAGNERFEGKNIILGDGSTPITVTINGGHQFGSLLVRDQVRVIHSDTDVAETYSMDLQVSGDLTIEAGATFDVNGKGYLGGRRGGNISERGRTVGNTTAGGSAFNAGGSHGGLGGGGSDGAVGAVYDDLLDPDEPGAGGGAHRPGDPGGDGGGLIRLSVGGNLLNNGVITANGSSVGGFFGAGGGGGGIKLDVGTLSGNGTIRANGGDAGTASAGIAMGGGGGGRIAVHYGSNEFTGQFEAHGGSGMHGGFDGGAGTIFVKDKDEVSGRLTLDNGGKAPEVASTPLPDAPTELISLHLLNGARPRSNAQANNVISEQLLLDGARTHYRIDGQHRLQTASLVLQNGATLAQVQTTTDAVHRIELTVTGDLTIDATSQINVSGAGYLGGRQGGNNSERGRTTGNTTAGGSAFNAGGSHGGLGGSGSDGAVGAVYDDLLDPEEPGAGGGAHRPGDPGGDGGGLIRLSVSGNLLNNGVINANGSGVGGFFGAGGAGGGIMLDVGTLSGNGTIRANGGDAGSPSAGIAMGGGGGGRIAVHYGSNEFTGQFEAHGGAGMIGGFDGGAGTIFVKDKDEASGRLTLDNGGKAPEVASTPLPDAPTELISLHLLNGARPRSNAQANNVISEQLLLDGARTHYRIDGQYRLQTASLVLQNGATLAQVQTTTDTVHRIELTVTGDLTIDATSQINVSGAGYLGGRQGGNNSERGRTTGNTTAGGSAFNAGGSHGGLGGGGSEGAVGAVYDDLLDPEEPGAGGGAHRPGDPGGDGGGLIRLSVSGNLLNNGVINANGSGVGGFFGAGGAGGGIKLDVGALSGNGTIRANGGDAGTASAGTALGGGGGGRIAVFYETNDFTGKIDAQGGSGMHGGANGAAGTIVLQEKS